MKVAIITGAGSGIGLGTALAFLEQGVAVVGIGRREARLKTLVEAAGMNAGRVATLAADVTADDAPSLAVNLAMEQFGRLDYLINNAGAGQPKPVHETDDGTLDASIDLMLKAPFRFIRAALPVMEKGSCIINISSTFALVGGLRGGVYSAAKAGLLGLTTHVACQYGSAGIRCNAVAPGVIPTEMTVDRLNSRTFKRMNDEMTPSDRRGRIEDVTSAILFLCSDAASWINGQCLTIDGGWSTTKYLSEEALAAARTDVRPKFTHSGKPVEDMFGRDG